MYTYHITGYLVRVFFAAEAMARLESITSGHSVSAEILAVGQKARVMSGMNRNHRGNGASSVASNA